MMQDYTTPVRGMACRQCERAIMTGLACVPGVLVVRACYADGTVSVRYDDAFCDAKDVASRLDALGYPAGGGRKGWFYDVVMLSLAVFALLFLQLVNLPAAPKAEEGASLPWLFAIGLLTGVHCVAMCGGIMLSQTMGTGDLGKDAPGQVLGRMPRVLAGVLRYSTGRVLSYTAMGAAFGAAGSAIVYGTSAKAVVLTAAGSLVAFMGLRMLGLTPRRRVVRSRHRRLRFSDRPWLVGLLTALMPCGALASMWLVAASSGSAVRGALGMLAFAAGTVPCMVAFGSVGAFLPPVWTKYVVGTGAALTLAFGASMVLNGARLLVGFM